MRSSRIIRVMNRKKSIRRIRTVRWMKSTVLKLMRKRILTRFKRLNQQCKENKPPHRVSTTAKSLTFWPTSTGWSKNRKTRWKLTKVDKITSSSRGHTPQSTCQTRSRTVHPVDVLLTSCSCSSTYSSFRTTWWQIGTKRRSSSAWVLLSVQIIPCCDQNSIPFLKGLR